MPQILRVAQPADIETVAALAREIWNSHYVSITGQAQIDYMLARFQSAPAIAGQIAQGYEYYLVSEGSDPAGYFALVPRTEEHSAQLSKIYVRREQQGRGLGRAVMAFVEARCAEMGIRELWLTVNRHNAEAIAFYKRMGFTTSACLVQDIGGGFVMDDYRMVKKVGPREE